MAAAGNDFKTLFSKHWQISKEFTLAVAEAMPTEYYDFKPNPEEMSFGELMSHIAQSNAEAFANVAETAACTLRLRQKDGHQVSQRFL